MSLPLAIFAVLLVGTGIMRLGELSVSLRRMRARPQAVVAEPALFPLMALLHTALVAAPLLEVLAWDRAFDPRIAAGAVAILTAATVLRIWTLRTIGGAWNVRVVEPRNDAIATTGPYRWIRHPNYLAVILEIIGLPLFHSAWGSVVALSALNGLVLFFRIRTEEAILFTVPAWRAAMQDRARFLPGVF